MFYSKYCKECPKLFSIIDLNRFVCVCVDHADIRMRVLQSKGPQITYVPSLLTLEKGKMCLYDRDRLIDWLTSKNYIILPDEDDEDSAVQSEEEEVFLSNPLAVQDRNTKQTSSAPVPSADTGSVQTTAPTVPSVPETSSRPSVLNLAQQMQREREEKMPSVGGGT